jgi:hypothetical protein
MGGKHRCVVLLDQPGSAEKTSRRLGTGSSRGARRTHDSASQFAAAALSCPVPRFAFQTDESSLTSNWLKDMRRAADPGILRAKQHTIPLHFWRRLASCREGTIEWERQSRLAAPGFQAAAQAPAEGQGDAGFVVVVRSTGWPGGLTTVPARPLHRRRS